MFATVAVGDVHGCLDELRELVHMVGYRPGGKVRLVLLGDFVDRGPESAACVRYAREIGAEAVRGNHDDAMLTWRRYSAAKQKGPLDERRKQWAALSEEDVAWIASLWTVIDLGPGYLGVHAGFEDVPMARQKDDRVMRCRYVDEINGRMVQPNSDLSQPPRTVYWTERWRGPDHVVYGHAVHSLTTPRVDEADGVRCYGIDTGCCYGGHLTALVLDPSKVEPEVVQVRARAVYSEMPKTLGDHG